MRRLVAGVEDARGLVRHQRRIGKRALRRNPAFGNGPAFVSEMRSWRFTGSRGVALRDGIALTAQPAGRFRRGNFFLRRGLTLRARRAAPTLLVARAHYHHGPNNARPHRCARHRQFGKSRRCSRPAEVGRRGAGARAGARRLRHRPRDRLRRLWLGAAGPEASGHRPRIPGQGAGGAGRVAASKPAISSSASCAGPIRCRVPAAPSANGTCAATAATPSAASRSATATVRIFSASSRTFWSSSIRRSA